VGDIFGAPLAIEGIFAFFMEATFISIMFFGWEKVSSGFHLASTWLTTAGATLSALWILVANAWMQHPVGWQFNPETARAEMADFWAVALSPFAINKFFHTVVSAWLLGAVVVIGISAWYLLKKRERVFALDSIRVALAVGGLGLLLTLCTGDKSAYKIAQEQPMKFAAMEGLYNGGKSIEITAIGIVNPQKKYDDKQAAIWGEVSVPKLLSVLATHTLDGYVPGVSDIIAGGYETNGINQTNGKNAVSTKTLSVAEKMRRGKIAIQALADYRRSSKDLRIAKQAKNVAAEQAATAALATHKRTLDDNFIYFGYGYFKAPADAIPHVPLTFYSFRIMVFAGAYFLVLFAFLFWFVKTKKLDKTPWLLRLAIGSIPLAYISSQAGWIVAEVGRQPWAIQDILPVHAAVSAIDPLNVKITFFIFLVLFSVLLAAELRILFKQIQIGPEPILGELDNHNNHDNHK
jgi:cytochrome d ubiquinol oxidase subunit I